MTINIQIGRVSEIMPAVFAVKAVRLNTAASQFSFALLSSFEQLGTRFPIGNGYDVLLTAFGTFDSFGFVFEALINLTIHVVILL